MKNTNWLKNAIIYHILIDRFNGCKTLTNRPDFLGGAIHGITQKIDYLHELGINAIWLSPFYETTAYHGYHITDFEKVDPHFGTTLDLVQLIQNAHYKNIKVIADFVPNHCSNRHPYFIDAVTNKNSCYRNWFIFQKWPDDYLCFLDFRDLPKFNLENPETRDYIIKVAKYWLSMGIDGLRLDHAIGPSHKFWKTFRSEVKSEYPDTVLIGEVWGNGIDRKHYKTINFKNKFLRSWFGVSQEKLQLEYYGELDGVFDFSLHGLIVESIKNGIDFKSKIFKKKVTKHFKKCPKDYALITFLDNHDMDRFLSICKGNRKVLLEALEFLNGLDQPISLYYGTENGMYNKTPVFNNGNFSDLVVREPVNWKKIDNELSSTLKELFHKRNITFKI